MMRTKTREKVTALLMAALVSLGAATESFAFTPWSNINGKWISADGKTVIEDAVEKGITVSKYQNLKGKIDWKQVADDEISFAMVRLGYYEDKDPYFDQNMKDADEAGIKTGVCFYSNATTVQEVKKEAQYVLDIVKDYKVSYPISYDLDAAGELEKKLTREQQTELVRTFCEEIEGAGYRVVVFGDYESLTKQINAKKVPYDVWYNRQGMSNNFQNRTMWRCTNKGKVNGIKGSVCIEFSFENYEDAFLADGWREINGTEYYFENYAMVKNRSVIIEGVRYRFDEEGNGTVKGSAGPGSMEESRKTTSTTRNTNSARNANSTNTTNTTSTSRK